MILLRVNSRKSKGPQRLKRVWSLFHVKMGDLHLLSVEKSRIREDLTKDQKYLKGRSENMEARIFSVVASEGIGGNGHRLRYRKIY